MAVGSISSTKEILHPAWMQWIIPSTGDLIFVALLGLFVYTALAIRLLGDAGIGWHIRTGQLILTTHAIPRVDPFSSTMAGRPWFAWEWLYDMLVGWLDQVAGLNGVIFFTASIIALTFSWAFRLLLRRGTSFPVALVLVLLSASASMIHFFARPHVVSWLFTIAWFCVLDSSAGQNHDPVAPDNSRYLWLLPLLMILWVNIHGGFLLAFVLLGIYWIGAVWEYFRLREERFEDAMRKISAGMRSRRLALVSVLSALATLVNPYGWKLHVHIYRYLSNRFLMDHIDEFQSPNFHGVAQKCFAGLLMLSLVALATKKDDTRGIRLSEALVMLFAVYSGLYAARNIPASALLLVLVIGPRLSDALQSLEKWRVSSRSQSQASPNFFQRMQNIEAGLRGHVCPVALLVITCWIVFHGGKLGTKPLMNAHFDTKRFPSRAVDYLESHNLHGAVFAPDSWGGYLIYRLYPQIKVAVDDRHDLYGEQFLKSYLRMMHVEPGWDTFLAQYPVRYVLIGKDSALANILAETPGWQPLYSDDVAIVFVPAKPKSQ